MSKRISITELFRDVPIEYRYTWCHGHGCACTGAANCKSDILKHGYTKDDWKEWVKNNPEPKQLVFRITISKSVDSKMVTIKLIRDLFNVSYEEAKKIYSYHLNQSWNALSVKFVIESSKNEDLATEYLNKMASAFHSKGVEFSYEKIDSYNCYVMHTIVL